MPAPSLPPLTNTQQEQMMTTITSISLAAVLALQIAHGVDALWRRQEQFQPSPLHTQPSPLSAFNYLHCSTLLRAQPQLLQQQHLAASGPTSTMKSAEARSQADGSSAFSAQFLESLWQSHNEDQRRQLLYKTLLVTNSDAAGSTGGRAARRKGRAAGAGNVTSLEVTVDLLQAEFRSFYVQNTPPRREAPYNSWEDEAGAVGPGVGLSRKSRFCDDWVDLEGGWGERADSPEGADALLRQQEEFVQWSLQQDHLGAVLCEYVYLCPLFKLFSEGGASGAFSWVHWAGVASTVLEQQWMDAEAALLCDAMRGDEGFSLGLDAAKGPTNTGGRAAGKKVKKKKKKSTRKSHLSISVMPPEELLVKRNQSSVEELLAATADMPTMSAKSSTLPKEEATATATECSPSDRGAEEMSEKSVFVDIHAVPAETESSVTMDESLCGCTVKAETTAHQVVDETLLQALSQPMGVATEGDAEIRSNVTMDSDQSAAIADPSATVCVDDINDVTKEGGWGVQEVGREGVCGESEAEASVAGEDDGDTSAEASLCSDHAHMSASSVVLLDREAEEVSSAVSAPIVEEAVEDTTEKADRSRGTLKSHKGDFLRTECDGDERPHTDSASRIDLIRWDQQRSLADTLTADVLDMAGALHRIANLRRPWQEAAIERVRILVQSIWPQAQCDVFGSFGTGLAIPSSDVDIVVSGMVVPCVGYNNNCDVIVLLDVKGLV